MAVRPHASAFANGGYVDLGTVVENDLGADDRSALNAHQIGGLLQRNGEWCFGTTLFSRPLHMLIGPIRHAGEFGGNHARLLGGRQKPA